MARRPPLVAAPAPVATARAGDRVGEVVFVDARTLLVHAYPEERRLRRWTLEGDRLTEDGQAYAVPGEVACLALHPGGRWAAVATTMTWSLRLIDLVTGEEVSQLVDRALTDSGPLNDTDGFLRADNQPAHASRPRALAFSPDGGTLYSVAGKDEFPSELRVWRTGPDPASHGQWLDTLGRPMGAPQFQHAALSPDGRWLLTLSVLGANLSQGPGVLEAWDVGSEPPPEEARGYPSPRNTRSPGRR